MSKVIVGTQNFYVDTTTPQGGECRNATFILPQGLMDCSEHQEMRVTLNSFSMVKNWYNVNTTNNVFYIVGLNGNAVTSTRVEVQPGNYQFFGPVYTNNQEFSEVPTLSAAISTAISQALARTHGGPATAFNVHINYVNSLFEIIIDFAGHAEYTDGVKLVNFTIPTGVPIPLGSLAYDIISSPAASHVNHNATCKLNSVMRNNQDGNIPVGSMRISTNSYIPPQNKPIAGDRLEWVHDNKHYHVTITSVIVTVHKHGFVSTALFAVDDPVVTATTMPYGTTGTISTVAENTFTEVNGRTNRFLNIETDYDFSLFNFNLFDSTSTQWNISNMLNGYTIENAGTGSISTPIGVTARFEVNRSNFAGIGITTLELADFVDVPATEQFFLTSSGFTAETVDTINNVVTIHFSSANGTQTTIFSGQAIYAHPISPGASPVANVDSVTGLDLDYAQYTAQCTFTTTATLNAGSTYCFRSQVGPVNIPNIADSHQYGYKIWTTSLLTEADVETDRITWSGMFANQQGSLLIGTVTDVENYGNPAPGPGPTTASVITSSLGVSSTNDFNDPNARSNWFQIDDVTTPITLRSQAASQGNEYFVRDQFQSFYELFGGCFEKRGIIPGATVADQFANLKSLAKSVLHAPSTSFAGFYPASLQTQENLYLRCSLNSSNFQSPGFDTGTQNNVANSQILAKIQIPNTFFAGTQQVDFTAGAAPDDPSTAENSSIYKHEVSPIAIFYTDNGNNNYSIRLSQKRTSEIRLTITDKYGRLIPEVSEEQVHCGQLAFTASLRIDTFENEAHR